MLKEFFITQTNSLKCHFVHLNYYLKHALEYGRYLKRDDTNLNSLTLPFYLIESKIKLKLFNKVRHGAEIIRNS